MILPPLHDRVGEHARSGKATRDRQLKRLRDEHLRQRVALPTLGHELRPDNTRDNERRRPALDDLAHFFADALERIEPLLLYFGREDLDRDARQMLRQRFAAGGLAARVLRDDLVRFRRLEGGVELSLLPLVEHQREHAE